MYGITGERVRQIVTILDPGLGDELRAERDRRRQARVYAAAARAVAYRRRLEARATRTEKRCHRCKTTKPLTEFPNNRYQRDGKGDVCHVCNRANVRAHDARRKANPVEPVAEKYCPGCEQTLPRSAFWRARASATGLQCYCIACSRLRNAGLTADEVRQMHRAARLLQSESTGTEGDT